MAHDPEAMDIGGVYDDISVVKDIDAKDRERLSSK